MSKLSKRQEEFTFALGLLIIFAFSKGYKLTCGDAYRDPRVFGEYGEANGYGKICSVHKLRLAKDFNLRVRNKFIRSSKNKAWDELHLYWESIGGAKRIRSDAGHFSFSWEGKR